MNDCIVIYYMVMLLQQAYTNTMDNIKQYVQDVLPQRNKPKIFVSNNSPLNLGAGAASPSLPDSKASDTTSSADEHSIAAERRLALRRRRRLTCRYTPPPPDVADVRCRDKVTAAASAADQGMATRGRRGPSPVRTEVHQQYRHAS